MGPTHWTIEYDVGFKRELKKLDSPLQGRILNFFSAKLCAQIDPRLFAKPLSGNLKHFWRYRIGDYRVICEFDEKKKIIFLVRIAHRREVYKHLHLVKPFP